MSVFLSVVGDASAANIAMILHLTVLQIRGRGAGVQQEVPLKVACCINKP